MGNQQERSLAWLAGIIDGEGTIGFQVYTLPDGRIRITPMFSVVNSDEGILTEAKRIMDGLVEGSKNAKVRWCNPAPKVASSFPGDLVCKTLRVDGIATRLLIEPLLPYLRSSKRQRAEAVLAYLKLRDANRFIRDDRGRLTRAGYSKAEIDIVVSARSHKRAKSSEAICSAPNYIG